MTPKLIKSNRSETLIRETASAKNAFQKKLYGHSIHRNFTYSHNPRYGNCYTFNGDSNNVYTNVAGPMMGECWDIPRYSDAKSYKRITRLNVPNFDRWSRKRQVYPIYKCYIYYKFIIWSYSLQFTVKNKRTVLRTPSNYWFSI